MSQKVKPHKRVFQYTLAVPGDFYTLEHTYKLVAETSKHICYETKFLKRRKWAPKNDYWRVEEVNEKDN